MECKWGALSDLADQNKIDFFIQGLWGPIQAQVLRTQPATLDEALNAAKAEEVAQVVDTRSEPDLEALVDKLAEKLASSNRSTCSPTAAGVNAMSSTKAPPGGM